MNDTKWDELRLAMYRIEPHPAWRAKCVENSYVSPWDREWFYHFRDAGYAIIEWVEIKADNAGHEAVVLAALRKIHVPGLKTEDGYRILGYGGPGDVIAYL
jgi:hypothetical protein